jgi:hypothetical protein
VIEVGGPETAVKRYIVIRNDGKNNDTPAGWDEHQPSQDGRCEGKERRNKNKPSQHESQSKGNKRRKISANNRTSTTLGTFATTEWMVIKLDKLASYEGTVRDERPLGGSSWCGGRVITVGTEPRKKKARPITDITITALGKEEMAIR